MQATVKAKNSSSDYRPSGRCFSGEITHRFCYRPLFADTQAESVKTNMVELGDASELRSETEDA
jgi:hypothetical protein